MNVACLPFLRAPKVLSGSPAGTIERAAKQQRHFEPLVDRLTGETRQAQIFVAVMGDSIWT